MKHIFWYWSIIAVLLVSCNKPDSIELSPNNDIIVSAKGGTSAITVSSSSEWFSTIQSDYGTSWVSVWSMGDEVRIIVSENNTGDERSATVIFTCGECEQRIQVRQEQNDVLSVKEKTYELDETGGIVQTAIENNGDFSFEIESSAKDWISCIDTKAIRESIISFAVSENQTPSTREGKITFRYGSITEIVNITQKGIAPILQCYDTDFYFSSEGGTGVINYTGNFKCETTPPDWITIVNHDYSDGSGKISFVVASYENDENGRSALIVLSGYGLKTGISISQRASINVISITTTSAGTLYSILGSSQRYQKNAYKISGPLNSVDISLIRDLACPEKNKTKKLRYLDLSDATIVSGGYGYWYKYQYDIYGQPTEDKDYRFTSKDNTITSYMFSGCLLETIILPKSVTTIESNAFMDFWFDSLTLPDNVTNIETLFDSVTSEEIILSERNQYYSISDGILFSKDMTTLLSCPSRNTKIRHDYIIPSTVKTIYPRAFLCCSIEGLVIPETVTSIGYYAFNRASIDSITIYPTTTYGYRAFGGASLHNVIISAGITTLGSSLFDLAKIKDMWVYSTIPPKVSNYFDAEISDNTILYVPEGTLTSYQLAPIWGEFKTIEEFTP